MPRRHGDVIQRSLFAHIRARGVKGLVAVHYPAGGSRKPAEAKILTGLGVLSHAGKSFALELKSETGRVSTAQAEMLDRLSGAGVTTAVCRGIDQALRCLEGWQGYLN
jgi:hypothetical protein